MTEHPKDFMNQWQRVSMLAIVYFFMSKGLKTLKELAMNAAPVFVGLLVAVQDKGFWFTMALFGFIVLIILDILVLYFTYRYRVEKDQVIVQQGLFTKEELNLKFERIQNINNSVPWYFKKFDLVRCALDSAGSSDKEVSIPGITRERADSISEVISRYKREHNDETLTIREESLDDEAQQSEQSDAVEANDNSLKLSNWEVTKYGFTNSMIFVFAGALFPVIEKTIEQTGVDISHYVNELAPLLPLPLIPAKILLVLLLMLSTCFLLLGVTAIGAFVRFHNYELYDEGKKLKRIAGLLERETIFLNKTKVQGVAIKQNILARLFGRVSIYFLQTQAETGNASKKAPFIIPMAHPDDWQKYVGFVYPELRDQKIEFKPVERKYLSRSILYLGLLPLSALLLPISFFVSTYFLFGYLLMLPISAIAYKRYKKYGYCVLDDYLVIRKGLIGTYYHVVERYKAQHMCEAISPSQRRHGLGSLYIQMAFGQLMIPYIKQSELRPIINEGIYQVESSDKSWM